jgi:hypothetical protein
VPGLRSGYLVGMVGPLPVRLLWLPLVIACSSSSSTELPSTPQEHVTAPAPSPILELKPLTVLFQGMPIARLYEDGRTESVGNNPPGKDATFSPGPTLHEDGTIVLTKSGFTARVEPDGDIFVVGPPGAAQPARLYGRLSGDQIVTVDAHVSGVRLEGAELVMFYDAKPTNVIGVVDPPSMGRTALVMTAAFFIDLALNSR